MAVWGPSIARRVKKMPPEDWLWAEVPHRNVLGEEGTLADLGGSQQRLGGHA